jgi:transposase
MASTMSQRARAFGERLAELDILNSQLRNLRSERFRYVTGVYKTSRSNEDERLLMSISGIDRETQEMVYKIVHLGRDPSWRP